MARIDIEDPYFSFLENQVKSGLFNTISEAARDAIRKQMELHEERRISSIRFELEKGEASLKEGRYFLYTKDLMEEISQKGKAAALEGKSIRKEVRP